MLILWSVQLTKRTKGGEGDKGTGRVLSEIIEQRESDRTFPASLSPFAVAEKRKTRICRSFRFMYFFPSCAWQIPISHPEGEEKETTKVRHDSKCRGWRRVRLL